MGCYPASGSPKPKNIPPSVSVWFGEFGGWESKSYMMWERNFPWPIDESFQPPVAELLACLHSFFYGYGLNSQIFDFDWRPKPEEGYHRFLGLLTNAINGLRIYKPVENSEPGPVLTHSQEVIPPTHDVTSDEAASYHRNSDWTDGIHRASTPTNSYHSEHPVSKGHVAERRGKKRMKTPSPRSSKRFKSDNH